MPSNTVICPGGSSSQTGTAVKERYSDVEILKCETISNVSEMLKTNDGPFVIPIWNSHEGEVTKARYFWDGIQDRSIKIEDAWAKAIDFWYVRRSGVGVTHGLIGSVEVAGTQCSEFFRSRNATLAKCALTTVALEQYTNGADWDGVLVAPGQGRQVGFEVVEESTANPNNFTSFVRIVPARKTTTTEEACSNHLTGVQIRAFEHELGSTESGFFDRLLGGVSDLEMIPKLLFVFSRESKVGLLFEGRRLCSSDLLDAEEVEEGKVDINDDAGQTENQYSTELKSLFDREFPALASEDFFMHTGQKTCLFGCPPLGLYTHGYEIKAVEPVFRYYIGTIFDLWYNGFISKYSQEQNDFFERYLDSWLDKRSDFIEFKNV